jgi:hypothetical protein
MSGFMLKPAVETHGIKHPVEEGSVIVLAVKQAVSFPYCTVFVVCSIWTWKPMNTEGKRTVGVSEMFAVMSWN